MAEDAPSVSTEASVEMVRRVVEVASGDSRNRQRFSIAHALGHYLLEHNPVYSEAEPRDNSDPNSINEREAHAFAAELLMPDEWVRTYWEELQKASGMASRYKVSEEAMWYRLEELRLIKF